MKKMPRIDEKKLLLIEKMMKRKKLCLYIIYRVILDDGLCEDVFQETICKILESKSDLPYGNENVYISSCCKNAAIDYKRRNKNLVFIKSNQSYLEDFHSINSMISSIDIGDNLDITRNIDTINNMLVNVGINQKCCKMWQLMGVSNDDMAKILGLTISSIEKYNTLNRKIFNMDNINKIQGI